MSGNNEEPRYDLRKPGSRRYVHKIPILKDSMGRTVDGLNRSEVYGWPETRDHQINDDHGLYLNRLVLNFDRRTVPKEEFRRDLNNLADCILREEGFGDIPQKIHEESGISMRWILENLKDQYKTRVTKKEPTRASPMEDLVKAAEETAPKQIQRTSRRYDNAINDAIMKSIGKDVNSIKQMMISVFDMSTEEIDDKLEGFKELYGDIWSRIYDRNDEIIVRKSSSTTPQSISQSDHEDSPTDSSGVERRKPETPTTLDPLLETVKRYYPEYVLSRVWDEIPSAKEKLPFMNKLIEFCYVYASNELGGDKEIIKEVLQHLSL